MINYQDGEITIVTLNAPERHNAITHDDFNALQKCLSHIESEHPNVVIFTGTGNSFCSGVDFSSLQNGDWAHNNPLNSLCERVNTLPMPTIAALNGHFVGGGAELAFSCDFRISVPTAKCKIPAASIAVHYEPSGIDRVVNVVGNQIARRLFLALETFCGDDLIKFKFVDQFSESPIEFALELSERISGLSKGALMGMKKSLNADNEDARERIEKMFQSEDFAKAMHKISAQKK